MIWELLTLGSGWVLCFVLICDYLSKNSDLGIRVLMKYATLKDAIILFAISPVVLVLYTLDFVDFMMAFFDKKIR